MNLFVNICTTVLAALATAAAPLAAQQTPLHQASVAARDAGVFAGATLRLPLGTEEAPPPTLSLSLAPMLRVRRGDGADELTMTRGASFDLAAQSPAKLTAGGRTLWQGGGTPPGQQRRTLNTFETVAVVVGGIAVIVLAGALVCREAGCLNGD